MLRTIALTLAMLGTSAPVLAADFADPTWPCVQRKVESLSAGLMWAVPMDATAVPDDADLQREIEALADALKLRRVPLDDLQPEAETFAALHDGNPDILGAVFMQTFDALNYRRTQVVRGIGDFSLSQIALSESIKNARTEMDSAMDAAEPDFDRVDALEEQLDWDQLIFSDRQKTIQYLCETPVIIEKRLFAIAQMLQSLVQEQG